MYNGEGFRCLSNDRAGADDVALFYCNVGFPFLLSIQGIYADTAGNIFSGGFCDFAQRTLDTVKDVVDDARSQKNGNGVALDGLSGTRACGFQIPAL